jgi:hypothetical protein
MTVKKLLKASTVHAMAGPLRTMLSKEASSLYRLLAESISLQRGRIKAEEFRSRLDDFYAERNSNHLANEVELERKRPQLDRPNAYKVDVMSLASDQQSRRKPWPMSLIWGRRFGILRHLRVRCDVLTLNQGAQVPPHGHRGVVSGFYVLEGAVGIRHYDIVGPADDGVIVRRRLNIVAEPGGFGTNSDTHHNVHWLCGIAPRSYLFRISLTGVPSELPSEAEEGTDRLYLDPTAANDESRDAFAPFITSKEAKELAF